MSNALAIAAITEAMRVRILNGINRDESLGGVAVTARPPDTARLDDTTHQVNLFLYHSAPNPAWRMVDPQHSRPGESGQTPLALKLYYLVTAYHGDNEDLTNNQTDRLLGSSRLLGLAMSTLHDFPNFDAATINSAMPPADQSDFPFEQIEHVRLSCQPLSIDEMSKLWSGFQTNYRPSAAYEASVVLIESTRPRRTALPVLRRGANDEGVFVFAMSAPGLTSLGLPFSKSSVELGDTITLQGTALPIEGTPFRFQHPGLETFVDLGPLAGSSDNAALVRLPALSDSVTVADEWPPGFYTVMARREQPPAPTLTSNALPIALAPLIESRSPASTPPGDFTLTITSRPHPLPDQRILLLFGEGEFEPASVTGPAAAGDPTTITFDLSVTQPGAYVIRLRVAGVDSIPLDFAVDATAFDPNQIVTVT
jgi:hypothetical protein